MGSAPVFRRDLDRGRASTPAEDLTLDRSDAAPGLLSPSAHDPHRAGARTPKCRLPGSSAPARNHLSWGLYPLQHIQDARSVRKTVMEAGPGSRQIRSPLSSPAPGCHPRPIASSAFLTRDALLLPHPGGTQEPLPRPQHSWGSPFRVSAPEDRCDLSAHLPLMRLPRADPASTATSGARPDRKSRTAPLATKRGALTVDHGPLQGVHPPGGVDIRAPFMTGHANRNSPGFSSLQGLSQTAAAGASTRLLPHA